MPDIKLITEESGFIAVHKPAGEVFHSEKETEGFVSKVRKAFSDEHLYPVHRLDRVTSGLMLFARGAEANAELSKAFEARKVCKHYLAFSQKKPRKKQGLVKGDMIKSRNGSYRLARSVENPAITRFSSKSFALHNSNQVWAFVLRPQTGKTHQLRVALKALGAPISGDSRYGGSQADRCYLHACKLSFCLFGHRYTLTDPNFYGDLLSNFEDFGSFETWRDRELEI